MINTTLTIGYSDFEERLRKQLVGKRIKSADSSSLTLENGTVLLFHNSYDCCAYSILKVSEIDFTRPVIISGINFEYFDWYEQEDQIRTRIHLLGQHRKLATIEEQYDDGAWYMVAAEIEIIPPETEDK